jgi:DnaJ like chaperone protein
MTAYEISVGAVCAIVGYVAISALWPERDAKKPAEEHREDQPAEKERAEEATRGGRFSDDDAKEQTKVQQWFEVLEVSSNASLDEVRRAYQGKISKYHPDKVAHLGPELQRVATIMTSRINAAYEEGCKQFGR